MAEMFAAMASGNQLPMEKMMQMWFMTQLSKDMEEKTGSGYGDGWADGPSKALDGFRSMQALEKKMLGNPESVVDNYHEAREESLDAFEKSWTWNDAARTINWRHYSSMHRLFHFLGATDCFHVRKQHRRAHMLTIQGMKSIHQIVRRPLDDGLEF